MTTQEPDAKPSRIVIGSDDLDVSGPPTVGNAGTTPAPGDTPNARPLPPLSSQALRPNASREYRTVRARRRSRPVRSVVSGIIALVMIGWFIYANQDAQRLQCLAYKVSGVSRPLPWTITCFMNGNL